jgi:hypothetical protein
VGLDEPVHGTFLIPKVFTAASNERSNWSELWYLAIPDLALDEPSGSQNETTRHHIA